MATHDIISEADGWAHIVDDVYSASFPSWTINAARAAAERDRRLGRQATLRCQGLDGSMHPILTLASKRTLEPKDHEWQMPAAAPVGKTLSRAI